MCAAMGVGSGMGPESICTWAADGYGAVLAAATLAAACGPRLGRKLWETLSSQRIAGISTRQSGIT